MYSFVIRLWCCVRLLFDLTARGAIAFRLIISKVKIRVKNNMNKTTKVLGKFIAASALIVSTVSLPAQAATFRLCVTGYEGTDINDNTTPYPYHNGPWGFTVEPLGGPPPTHIKFTVTSTPPPGTPGHDNGDNQYINFMATIPIIKTINNTYYFSGEDNQVSLTGTYNGTQLSFSSIISGDTHYTAVPCPEPTSILSLLALGTLGTASTLKRKLKPSKSTEKETTKVS